MFVAVTRAPERVPIASCVRVFAAGTDALQRLGFSVAEIAELSNISAGQRAAETGRRARARREPAPPHSPAPRRSRKRTRRQRYSAALGRASRLAYELEAELVDRTGHLSVEECSELVTGQAGRGPSASAVVH